MSDIALSALQIAIGELAAHVRGGVKPYAKFRGPEVDGYQRAVGLHLPPDPTVQGNPWCASAVFWCFEQASQVAAGNGDPTANPCPKTPGALHLWDSSPDSAKTQSPAPGCVFVLDRGKGRGHVGFVVSVSGPFVTTCEPDTFVNSEDPELAATGDCWGEHTWAPADNVRGRLVGYLMLG